MAGKRRRSQHLGQDDNQSTLDEYLISRTTSATAHLGVSYALSPVTYVSGIVTTGRTQSSFQDSYITTTEIQLGRQFRRRWFLQVHGGSGMANPVRSLFRSHPSPADRRRKRWVQDFHTGVSSSYAISVSDSYGLGTTRSSTLDSTWRWTPRAPWWVETSMTWQDFQGNVVNNNSGWRASAGVGRILNRHLTLLTQYFYLYYPAVTQLSSAAAPLTSGPNIAQNAVRVSLVWTPRAASRQRLASVSSAKLTIGRLAG